MDIFELTTDIWKFNRERTLATLDEIEKASDPRAALGWRPGPERAHMAWQLMHIGMTEELFATQRLLGKTSDYAELAPRFKGGSTPDDDIPSLESIRDLLNQSREHLLSTMATFTTDDLAIIPEPFKERGWTLATILKIVAWHEPHHQGQAHLNLNLFRASQT